MKAKSIKGKSTEDIKSALQQILADGFKPTLAFVFISIRQDRKAIAELLHNEGIDVFGATSCGEFIDGYQGEGSIVVLLLDLPRDVYSVVFENIGDRSIKDAGNQLAVEALQRFANPSLILCSTGMNTKGEYFDGEALIQALQEPLGKHRTFYGGMAGDDMTFTGSFVFTHEKETDFGLAAVVLDADKVAMQGMAITGWKPLGISRTVTKSKGDLVYAIDDIPAVEMYLQYLGIENGVTFNVMNDYPFIVERQSGETVLRTPLSINDNEKALQMDIAMPEGTTFWFSAPPDFDIVEKVLHEAERIKKGNTADALLVFSCAGRINVLGPLVNSENEGLHEVWKTPMAEFFSYGEFGRDSKNRQEFHSGACCWVTLKEKYK